MTCTQEELLQVLSKLMQERKKVKALELRLNSDSKPTQDLTSTLQNETLKKKVTDLEGVIADLQEKLVKRTEVPAPVTLIQPSVSNEQLKAIEVEKKRYEQEALRLRSELMRSETRAQELLEQIRNTAPHKIVPDFSFELETCEKELRAALQKIQELEQSVVEAKKQVPRAYEEELENIRLLARELTREKKELETRLHVTLQEKQGTSDLHDAKTHEVKQLIQERNALRQDYDVLRKREDELSFTHATTLDELQKMKLDFKRLDSDASHQKGEIALLEEHLTRRMKECTSLTSQLEETSEKLEQKSKKLERLEEEHTALKEKKEEEIALFKGQLAAKENELSELQNLAEEYEEELYELRKISERYRELEETFGRCEKIMSRRSHEVKRPSHKQPPSSDFFKAAPSTNRRYDLFQ